MRIPTVIKRLAVLTGISAALAAWRNVMLSINEAEPHAGDPAATGAEPDRERPDISLPPK
jgi:hypothetical protein